VREDSAGVQKSESFEGFGSSLKLRRSSIFIRAGETQVEELAGKGEQRSRPLTFGILPSVGRKAPKLRRRMLRRDLDH
jgi:hypothetical protein